MYFVSNAPRGPGTLAAFLAASGMRIYDLSQLPELHAAAELMERYADTPMDYADATLVLLRRRVERRFGQIARRAQETSAAIVTRESYRTGRKREFAISAGRAEIHPEGATA